MTPEVKTSAEWQAIHPNPRIMDPDGWDRTNFQYSWFEEQITFDQYRERLFWSTIISYTEDVGE